MPTAASIADYLTRALARAVGEDLPADLEVGVGPGGPAGGQVVLASVPGRVTIEVWPMVLDHDTATVSFTAVTLADPAPHPSLVDRLLRRPQRVHFGVTVLDPTGTTLDDAWMLRDADAIVRAIADALADRTPGGDPCDVSPACAHPDNTTGND